MKQLNRTAFIQIHSSLSYLLTFLLLHENISEETLLAIVPRKSIIVEQLRLEEL